MDGSTGNMVAAIIASINVAATLGGGFYFMGRVMGRLDTQDVKISHIETQVSESKGMLTNVAVDASRLTRVEDDIHELRRGVGFINDGGARTVNREY